MRRATADLIIKDLNNLLSSLQSECLPGKGSEKTGRRAGEYSRQWVSMDCNWLPGEYSHQCNGFQWIATGYHRKLLGHRGRRAA